MSLSPRLNRFGSARSLLVRHLDPALAALALGLAAWALVASLVLGSLAPLAGLVRAPDCPTVAPAGPVLACAREPAGARATSSP
jgi:hypothetical protein